VGALKDGSKGFGGISMAVALTAFYELEETVNRAMDVERHGITPELWILV
jgi:hypothetical protein